MSNDFDIERAKRGEPIQRRNLDGHWIDVHYVGRAKNGFYVFECDEGEFWRDDFAWPNWPNWRMKPQPRYALIFQTREDACRVLQAGQRDLARQGAGVQMSITELPEEK